MERKENLMRGNRIIGGLLVFALAAGFAGCAGKKTEEEFKTQEKDVNVKHKELHHEHGPHEGHVADLGTDHQYRVELTYTKKPKARGHGVCDGARFRQPRRLGCQDDDVGAGSKAIRSRSRSPPTRRMTIPKANSRGTWSRGKRFPLPIQGLEDIHGHLKVEVGGKTLEADFDHDHDHDHEDEDEEKHAD